MFCSECGAKNDKSNKYCANCGKLLNENLSDAKGLIAKRIDEKEKEVQIIKSATKTVGLLKFLCLFLFVLGCGFILASFFVFSIPFTVCCVICYCISLGLNIASGLLKKASKSDTQTTLNS